MFGPEVLAANLARGVVVDAFGNEWQYNSRSDRHSKIGCWGVALDLLRESSLLREHAAAGKVVLGVNHELADFLTPRKKKLDLVIARPGGEIGSGAQSFRGLAAQDNITLTEQQLAALIELPDIYVSDVGAVLVAIEAKAAMTAHVKALPRLYDELNSSHLCVHGSSEQALAIAYVQINRAEQFASSVVNKGSFGPDGPYMTRHNQPRDTLRTIKKIAELPRRNAPSGNGFDGIGITVLDFENIGGPVRVSSEPPAPGVGDAFHYDNMIVCMAREYDSRFRHI